MPVAGMDALRSLSYVRSATLRVRSVLHFICERAEGTRRRVPGPGQGWGMAEPALTCRPTRAQILGGCSVENRVQHQVPLNKEASGLEAFKLSPLCFRASGPRASCVSTAPSKRTRSPVWRPQ